MSPRISICSCGYVQSGVITGCNIGIFSGSEFFQSGQAVVQAHGIALAVFATMDKVVYKKRVILEHDAALEGISYLKSGIPGINRLEHPSTDIFYYADAVRKPADTDTVAGVRSSTFMDVPSDTISDSWDDCL